MSLIPFPNIPNVPGVPNLARLAGSLNGAISGALNQATSGVLSATTAIASITGNAMSVTSIGSGLLAQGQSLLGNGVAQGTKIVGQLTGALGGIGSYLVSPSQNVASTAMSALGLSPDSSVLGGDTAPSAGGAPDKTWSIVDAIGDPIITPDSVVALEYRGEARIATYPVENGSFASFNKVQVPFDIRVLMTCNGQGAMTRPDFLTRLESMRSATDLYTLISPDFVYQNVNLVHLDYRRTSKNGVTLLTIDTAFEEVRVSATAAYNASQPSGADPTNDGAVDAAPPTAAQDAPTNYVSGSINDAVGAVLPPNADAELQAVAGDPAAALSAFTDHINNPPPGLSASSLASYASSMATKFGIKIPGG